MRLSLSQKLQLQQSTANARPSEVDLNGLVDLVMGGPGGHANPMQRKAILSPERTAWYTGPKGTGKTEAGAASALLPAILYPGSRWLVARWRYWSLKETTLKAFDRCLDRLGRADFLVEKEEGPPKIYRLATVDPTTGKPGPLSEVTFNGLDDYEKVASIEYTGIIVDEANEIELPMANALNTLLRHKRPGCARATGPYFLRFISNPVTRSHWLHLQFCGEEGCASPPMGVKYNFPSSENLHNLPEGYYTDISRGMLPSMVARYIHGVCGPDPNAGDAIFTNDFHESLHVRDLKADPAIHAGIRGWDFGRRRPACVWAQVTPYGAINYLYALLGENESLKRFADRVLATSRIQFPTIQSWTDYCDPHGEAQRDVSPETSISILQDLGLRPVYRHLSIKTGLEAITTQLKTLVGARPRAQFDRVGCAPLIEGFQSGYVWGTRGGAGGDPKPKADGFYEHYMDAMRYIAVGLSTGNNNAHARSVRPRPNSRTGY